MRDGPGPTLIYDGDCAHCATSARWIEARWPAETTAGIVASQRLTDAELAGFGISRRDAAQAAWWIDGGRTYRGHQAIGRALLAAGGGYEVVGSLLLVPPVSWAVAVGYAIVARHRHLLPGSSEACRT